MDRTDIKIPDIIQHHARVSTVKLAEMVSLTPTPCARRIQNLERDGLIKDYVALLDQNKVGLPINALVELRMVREHEDEITDFETNVKQYPEITECYTLSGGHDYLLRVVSSDLESYH